MRDLEFEKWLEEEYVTKTGSRLQKRPRSDALSRCRRIEKYHGNLDQHFQADRLQNLLDLLTYSRADQDAGVSPRHRIPIDGDTYNGTASLRSAMRLYLKFCEYN